jgi:hypothetical protein
LKSTIKRRLFKSLAIVLTLALFLSTVPISASANSATNNLNGLNDQEEKGLLIIKLLEKNEAKTNFSSFDDVQAKKNGLTDEEITNVKATFLNLSDQQASLFIEAKIQMEGSNPYVRTAAYKDTLKLAATIATMVFVGQAVMNNLLSDLYKLGAKRFCKVWSPKFKPIKKSCKSLGYIK